MGFSFVRGSTEGDDEQEYAALMHELFDGLIAIVADFILQTR